MNIKLFIKGVLLSLAYLIGITLVIFNYNILGGILASLSVILFGIVIVKGRKDVLKKSSITVQKYILGIVIMLILIYLLYYFIEYFITKSVVPSYSHIYPIIPMLFILFGLIMQKQHRVSNN